MAILSGPSGEIQVRIQKEPFDVAEPVFFDEYAKIGVRDDEMECTRYLVPETTAYAIYILVTAPFKFEKWLGLRINMIDEATNCEILSERYEKDCMGIEDQIIQIEGVDQGKNASQFSMNALPPDETSVNEPGGSGNGPNYLKGFRVEIYKYGEQKIDQEWRKDNGHIGSRYNIQKKGEFTDGTCSTGGLHARTRQIRCEKMTFRFTYNSADFLERNNIVKTPIPNIWQPYDFLTKYEQEEAFKTLRAYDLDQLVKQWERGEIPPKKSIAPNPEPNPLFQETMAVSQAPVSPKTAKPIIAAVEKEKKHQREAIVISDSDDDSTSPASKQLADSPNIAQQVNIKLEPNDAGSGLVRLNSIKQEEEPLTKRVKPNSVPVDNELLRLREEDEREEEELLAAQRVAELIRKRNERKAKMAEIEARSSPS